MEGDGYKLVTLISMNNSQLYRTLLYPVPPGAEGLSSDILPESSTVDDRSNVPPKYWLAVHHFPPLGTHLAH